MSNPDTSELLSSHNAIIAEIGRIADKNLDKQDVIEKVSQSIDVVRTHLIELFAKNQNKKFIFVVGGKSRVLTELLLSEVARTLPQGNEKINEAVSNRVRLNDQENKNLYGKSTSRQGIQGTDINPNLNVLKSIIKDKDTEVVVFDESIDTGTKAFRILQFLKQAGIKAHFFAFASHDRQGSRNFVENMDGRVVVGTHDEATRKTLKSIAALLSEHVNLRLNNMIDFDFNRIPISIDDLPPEKASNLRKSHQLLTKLKKKLVGLS